MITKFYCYLIEHFIIHLNNVNYLTSRRSHRSRFLAFAGEWFIINITSPEMPKTKRLYSGENRAVSRLTSCMLSAPIADMVPSSLFQEVTELIDHLRARSPYTTGLLAPLSRPSTYDHDPKFPTFSRTSAARSRAPRYPPFFRLIFFQHSD